jgi:hypothetical protein
MSSAQPGTRGAPSAPTPPTPSFNHIGVQTADLPNSIASFHFFDVNGLECEFTYVPGAQT